VSQAEGIDITEAMIERSKALAKEKKLTNTSFRTGDAEKLPYKDRSFNIVTTRYSFHHFLNPLAVLKEMKRICKPGGKVCVVDMLASVDPAKAANFNRLEVPRGFVEFCRCNQCNENHFLGDAGSFAQSSTELA
jgi:ubiquinone/menaquinone biosynthesis C-methylase UbiE